MIEQDASTVRDRQETDSIAVVDDIRSHIRCSVSAVTGTLVSGSADPRCVAGHGSGQCQT